MDWHPALDSLPDDRVRCRDCRLLQGKRCVEYRDRPDPDRMRHCGKHAPRTAGDGRRRSVWIRVVPKEGSE